MPGSLPGPVALHSWTLGRRPLGELLQVAAQAGYDAVEINWQDIARCRTAGMSDRDIAAMVADGPVAVVMLGTEPGWLFARGDEAARLWDVFHDMAEMATMLHCPALMSAVGRHAGTIETARDAMRSAADLAAGCGLVLGIEFNAGHPTLGTLDAVRDVVRAVGSPHCGLVLDTYHLHRGGQPGGSFAHVPTSEIVGFQFSDVPESPVEADGPPTDRLPPGQGTVRWHDVLALLAAKGYRGPMVYEAPNPDAWAREPLAVATEGLNAFRRLVDEAAPSGGAGTAAIQSETDMA